MLTVPLCCGCCLQSIQERANNKEHMLAMVNAERKATNDRKRIERELFDSLRRDKVDSIQKMQVGGGSGCYNHLHAVAMLSFTAVRATVGHAASGSCLFSGMEQGQCVPPAAAYQHDMHLFRMHRHSMSP